MYSCFEDLLVRKEEKEWRRSAAHAIGSKLVRSKAAEKPGTLAQALPPLGPALILLNSAQ